MEPLGVVVGVLLGTIGGVYWAKKGEKKAKPTIETPDDWVKAFKNLENEFEDLKDFTKSQLGRISRIKQDTARLTTSEVAATAPASLTMEPTTRSSLVARAHGR